MEHIDKETSGTLAKILEKLDQLAQDVLVIKTRDTQIAYSVTQTAKKCGCSRGTIRNLYEKGKIEGFQEKAGGKIYLYKESVYKYLNQTN